MTTASPMQRVSALLLAAALIASACSSSIEAGAAETTGARSLVEPSTFDIGESGDVVGASEDEDTDDVPGAIAFENDAVVDDDAEESETDVPADETETSGDTTSTSTTTTAKPLTELDRLVNTLIDFVETERGYAFTSQPTIQLLDSGEFSASWSDLIARDAAEFSQDYANFTDIYRAMGVIGGDRTLEEIWTRFGDAGVIGYYDPDIGAIKLRAGELTTFTETVLVHELVHALEDQVFGLDRDEYDDREDEVSWTFSALTEGSARRIESRYRATFSAEEAAEETAARRALPRTVSLSEFNTSFLELQFGRYRYGEAFATALWADGKSSLDRALAEPPTTSELVLDPAAYLSGAVADPTIARPPADAEVFESGVWGEAAWAAVLADTFDRTEALALADGWGGDRFVAWRQGGQACVRTHIEADTANELDDYATALETWARDAGGREIFYPTADIVRVTACG